MSDTAMPQRRRSTTAEPAMPRGVKWAVGGVVTLLMLGAVALVALRGEALLLDLSAMSSRLFCL